MRKIDDHYAKLARKEGYLARSVYKLKEIQEKFKIIKKGNNFLDLGAAPGSWSQLVLEITQGTSKVIGVDLKPIDMKSPFSPKFKGIQGSFRIEPILEQIIAEGPYDIVISDAAPSTSGDPFIDACKSAELAMTVLDIAEKNLKKGGNIIIKIFQGGDEQNVMARMKQIFEKTKAFKPKASRNESVEIFYIGFNLL